MTEAHHGRARGPHGRHERPTLANDLRGPERNVGSEQFFRDCLADDRE